MADAFEGQADGVILPSREASYIYPNDAVDVNVTKGVYIDETGVANFVFVERDTPISMAVVAGTILPFRIKRLMATATTVGRVIGLY